MATVTLTQAGVVGAYAATVTLTEAGVVASLSPATVTITRASYIGDPLPAAVTLTQAGVLGQNTQGNPGDGVSTWLDVDGQWTKPLARWIDVGGVWVSPTQIYVPPTPVNFGDTISASNRWSI